MSAVINTGLNRQMEVAPDNNIPALSQEVASLQSDLRNKLIQLIKLKLKK